MQLFCNRRERPTEEGRQAGQCSGRAVASASSVMCHLQQHRAQRGQQGRKA